MPETVIEARPGQRDDQFVSVALAEARHREHPITAVFNDVRWIVRPTDTVDDAFDNFYAARTVRDDAYRRSPEGQAAALRRARAIIDEVLETLAGGGRE